jgi:ubiquitin-protein ligase E3 C
MINPFSSTTILPAFGDEWKRKINLGGVSSTNTQAAILNRVQAERAARAEHKQRTESAVRIQAWYRGLVDARATRQEMRKAFNADVMGLTGLRCLVLIGKDDEVLGTWTRAVLQLGPGAFTLIFHILHHLTSWKISCLLRQEVNIARAGWC